VSAQFLSAEWRLILATGICGGFTTFSAFSAETFSMMREGQIWNASVYIVVSLLLGILATMIGYSLTRLF
jgi:CrcB protein